MEQPFQPAPLSAVEFTALVNRHRGALIGFLRLLCLCSRRFSLFSKTAFAADILLSLASGILWVSLIARGLRLQGSSERNEKRRKDHGR